MCSSQFEIWGQDIENIQLSQRDLDTFDSRRNYLFPQGSNGGVSNSGVSNNGVSNSGVSNSGVSNNGVSNNGVSDGGVSYKGKVSNVKLNTNTKINRSEHETYDSSNLRPINIETNLFLIGKPLDRDGITLAEAQSINTPSSRQLYRTYHAPEINSICYPNQDRNAWDTTTKALYRTIDHRT
jgi:hypothetical protein